MGHVRMASCTITVQIKHLILDGSYFLWTSPEMQQPKKIKMWASFAVCPGTKLSHQTCWNLLTSCEYGWRLMDGGGKGAERTAGQGRAFHLSSEGRLGHMLSASLHSLSPYLWGRPDWWAPPGQAALWRRSIQTLARPIHLEFRIESHVLVSHVCRNGLLGFNPTPWPNGMVCRVNTSFRFKGLDNNKQNVLHRWGIWIMKAFSWMELKRDYEFLFLVKVIQSCFFFCLYRAAQMDLGKRREQFCPPPDAKAEQRWPTTVIWGNYI